MNCGDYENKLTDLANNQLPQAERKAVEEHLAGCAACSQEFAEIQQLWAIMGAVEAPEPSPNLKVKFNAMLATYKESEADSKSTWATLNERLRGLWRSQPRWPLAYSMALVLICLGGGFWFLRSGKIGGQDQELQALTTQVHELRQTMTLALLENPSASERMRGVSYTSDLKNADKEVIDALLATLNNDSNVNVRLSTLDALARLADHAEVREGLIQSIAQQESPLMQSAIADVMLKLQEKRSVGSFRQLLKQKNLDNGVRDKIRQTITKLI